MASAHHEYANDVREHYEELPYPYRDPAQEGQQFHGGDGFGPDALNHAAWGGRRDLRQGGRILIVGDGTGDASVQWAESMLGSSAEVVAIDLSSRSIALAKERLARRQLTNVAHHHLSLLDLPTAGFGEFDVIECSGVLHHLPDPAAGLRALGSVLKPDGVMSLMVYGEYGRVAIYMVQDMLRRLMKPGMTREEKIRLARGFLNHVPNTHWLTVKNELFLTDINWPDGSGIYDLLLHSTDRAYTVPQLYDWVEGEGLMLAGLFSDHTDDSLYRPEHYTSDPMVLGALEGKTDAEKFAIGELMHGSMAKHNFYVSKQKLTEAAFAGDMVITYGLMQALFANYLQHLLPNLAQASMGERVACMNRPLPNAPHFIVTKRPSTALLLQAIDGTRTIDALVHAVAAAGGGTPDAVRDDLQLLYKEMRARLMVTLRHESVPPYPSVAAIYRRLKAIGLFNG